MADYNVQIKKYNKTSGEYDNLNPSPMKHANTHKKNGSDPLTAADVGARPDTWFPTASQVGARPDTWTPTATQVGAVPSSGGTMTGNLTAPWVRSSGSGNLNATPSRIAVFDSSNWLYYRTPSQILSDIGGIGPSALNGYAKIQTGTYTGNGNSGDRHPNQISFSFTPKVVYIALNDLSDYSYRIYSTLYLWGAPNFMVFKSDSQGGLFETWNVVSRSGNTMSWYNINGYRGYQLNESDVLYRWVALG